MIIVSDAGPIIHLSLISKLDLLPTLYGRILVPREVYLEVVNLDDEGLPGAAELKSAKWIDLTDIDPEGGLFRALTSDLDRGEAAALCLAIERAADLVLADEKASGFRMLLSRK